jgi:ribonuclease Z
VLDYEVRYEAKKSDRSKAAVKKAVKKVGNSRTRIIAATSSSRSASRPNNGSPAALAAVSDVKQLLLTHISGRYPDEEILAEATKIFPNNRVAIDFDRITI